ncbi:cache domain-containing sensor histidine kinase [Paenibacillus aestuarii]|uniref:histidine kinase n=1 Tax=Paenibacillus aestuarii TaxID=516965 RepID=A0ABW0KHK4_9BACL|nr:sensor histidine kinase [Paenibacillus aestuarii]
MGHLSQKQRIIVSTMILSIASQLLFNWIGYWNIRQIGLEARNNSNQALFETTQSHILSAFKSANSVATMMLSTAYTEDPSSLATYQDSLKNLESKDEELNEKINNLHISSDVLEKIILVGGNDGQRSFLKFIGSQTWFPKGTPTLDELRRAGITDILIGNSGLTVYYGKGQLSKRAISTGDAEVDMRINRFIEQLEGRVVIGNSSNMGNSLVFVALNPDFAARIIAPDIQEDVTFTLASGNGELVWTNYLNPRMAHDMLSHAPTDGSRWSFSVGSSSYEMESTTLSPYGFKLWFAKRAPITNTPEMHILLMNVFVSLIGLIVACVMAHYLSTHTLKPFHRLSKLIHKQVTTSQLANISLAELKYNSQAASSTLQYKMFKLHLIVVIIPVLVSGVFGSNVLYRYAKDQLTKQVKLNSSLMMADVRGQMNTYESLIYHLASDSHLQKILSSFNGKNSASDSIMNSYQELSDITSYFVLYDQKGKPVYSSAFPSYSQLNIDPMDVNSRLLRSGIPVWNSQDRDIFKHQAVSVFKSVVNPNGTVLGVVQFVLKAHSFPVESFVEQSNFVIVNGDGGFVYENSPRGNLYPTAKELQAEFGRSGTNGMSWNRKIDGIDHVAVSQKVPDTDWTMFVFTSMDNLTLRNTELLYRNIMILLAIIMLSFLMAWFLSKFMIKPLTRLSEMMQFVGKGNFNQFLFYSKHDEIGVLVNSFNQMVIRIQELLEENVINRVRENELLALKSKAELRMLQQQINPHFLYNTLQAIDMRARKYKAADVSIMVSSLARIFRYSISTGDTIVPLSVELEHIRNFIRIQEIRFPEQFKVEWSITDGAGEVPVMKFILQPLVENSIQHGIGSYMSGGLISVSAHLENNHLVIEVCDNGVGMDEEQLATLRARLQQPYSSSVVEHEGNLNQGSGVGLRNVYQRLKLFYHDHVDMSVESEPLQGSKIRIMIQRSLL